MFKFKKIRNRILFYVISFTVVIFLLIFGYLSIKSRTQLLIDTKNYIKANTQSYANILSNRFNYDLGITKAIASSFTDIDGMDTTSRNHNYSITTYNLMRDNPDYVSVWLSIQLNYYWKSWGNQPGRISFSFYRKDGQILEHKQYRDVGGIVNFTKYHEMMQTKKETFMEPYFDIGAFAAEKMLMTSLATPILTPNNDFIGVIGVDLEMSKVQEFTSKINIYKNSYPILISNKGLLVSHPNKSLIGKSIDSVYSKECAQFKLPQRILKGETFQVQTKGFGSEKEVFVTFAPLVVGNTGTPWSLGIVVPVKEIVYDANISLFVSLGLGILGILILAVIISLLIVKVTKPIEYITSSLKEVAKGNISENCLVQVQTNDEVTEMAKALNTSISGLLEKIKFAEKIGKGELNHSITILSDADIFSKALQEMQQNLIKAKEEDEKRKAEDTKRRWLNEGVALFNDIMRQNTTDIHKLSYQIIQNLIQFIKADQGGVFIANYETEGEPLLELTACFAYDRQKFIQKTIHYGEGLIGACFYEQKTTYITEIPRDYFKITSGLGGELPRCLAIVPMLYNDELYGVFEIASFNYLEPQHLEFIEKIGENFAATIRNVKSNIRTTELLRKSQDQAEIMRSQEEEMRQNMEELAATQEESARKAERMHQLLQENQTELKQCQQQILQLTQAKTEYEQWQQAMLKNAYYVAYDRYGKIIEINPLFLEFIQKQEQGIKDQHFQVLHIGVFKQAKQIDEIIGKIIHGQHEPISLEVEDNDDIKYTLMLIPLSNAQGELHKIMEWYIA